MKRRGLWKRGRTGVAAAVCLCALLAALPAVAADYFVSKQGNDANNGQAKETAFLTIEKGVNTLSPGDTLTIGPGEYFESVSREGLGSADADTVIRAEIPGTVLMRGDADLPEIKKVEGYRFIHAVACDEEPRGVLEHDTLSILTKRPTILDVEYEPGAWYYDAAQKTVYLSSTDLRSPAQRRYTAAVSGETGIRLNNAKRVVIEGVAIGGFYPGWSILMDGAASCTVRDCAMYMGTGGICIDHSGGNNVVERCESYGHTFGGIVFYRAKDDIARNCRTYETKLEGSEHFGIMHYFNMPGTLLIQDCISWGQNFDFSVKPSQQERLERCVALGFVRVGNLFNNLIGSGNEYGRRLRQASADNILFLREEDLDQDFEFADPLNLDFRLQADSRFRGAGPDGTDCGPYQYEENIFYVAPGGDDENDGLSMRKPWRTLQHALGKLRPGDTLYLAEGKYAAAPLNETGDGKSPIRICGRGHGTVVVNDTMNLAAAAGLVFERIKFAGGATVSNSRDVEFKNCTFYGAAEGLKATGVNGLKVTHSVFVGVPLELAGSNGAFLSSNLYANNGKPAVSLDSAAAVRYSDYNSYQDKANCWMVGGATWPLAELHKSSDHYSLAVVPTFVMPKDAPVLANADNFNGRGRLSKDVGEYREREITPLRLSGPILHSVSDTTANIEWWTSKPATCELAWGDTPEMANKIENVKPPDRFTTYSLTGLKPGTTYYFQIRSADATGTETATRLEPKAPPLTFKTLATAPEPMTYSVAPDGNDDNSGLNREQAWRTVSHAARSVNPGDTVLIAGGDYHETVRVRATGDEGKPIIFRCAPGEKVAFSGRNLNQAFKVIVKKNVHFDGFYFEDFGNSMDAVFALWHADDVRITRCFNVKGSLNISFLSADYCANLLVKNCVTAGGFSSLQLHVSPNWTIENNLLLRPLIMALYFVNEPEQKGFFRKNIVSDNLPKKVIIPLVDVGRFRSFVERDNCYFLRAPDEKRKMLRFFGTAAYERYVPSYGVTTDYKEPPVFVDNPDGTENNPRFSLKEYQAMVGDTGSFVGDPKFAGTANMEEGGTLWTGDPATMFDKLLGKKGLDFPDTFATDPKAVEKGVGPQPDAFKDFWFNKK